MLLAKSPERGSTAMAQRSIGIADENRRHPSALAAQLPAADRVDAAIDGMKSPGMEPVFDRA
jgi:hypothetical protein